jgi:hypothetical protein
LRRPVELSTATTAQTVRQQWCDLCRQSHTRGGKVGTSLNLCKQTPTEQPRKLEFLKLVRPAYCHKPALRLGRRCQKTQANPPRYMSAHVAEQSWWTCPPATVGAISAKSSVDSIRKERAINKVLLVGEACNSGPYWPNSPPYWPKAALTCRKRPLTDRKRPSLADAHIATMSI